MQDRLLTVWQEVSYEFMSLKLLWWIVLLEKQIFKIRKPYMHYLNVKTAYFDVQVATTWNFNTIF